MLRFLTRGGHNAKGMRSASAGHHRGLYSTRKRSDQHRDQSHCVPQLGDRAGLSRLLRSDRHCRLLFLRWLLLGLQCRGRTVVLELLVQRAMGLRRARVRASAHSRDPVPLLPGTPGILGRMGLRRTASLGAALGI